MPTVPLLTPTAAPSEGGVAGPNLAVPVEAFGGAVGHAISGLGEAVSGAADKIWAQAVAYQNLQNDTEAKKADADFMIKTSQMRADFLSKEGDNARTAYPGYIQGLQDTRDSIRGGLSNPMVQKMYDSSSTAFMGREIFNGAAHAGQQTKIAAKNASESRVQILTDNIGDNPADEEGFQSGIRAIKGETQSQGENGGWSPDQIKATTDANVSSAVAKRIVGLAKTDPFAAQRMFDSATEGKNLSPNDSARVQATIQTQTRQAIPRGISGEVNADLDRASPGGVPEKSLEDRIAEGQAKAEKYAKNDPLLQDFVKQRIITDYTRSKAIQKDFDQRNINIVDQALMTGNKEGLLPTSADQLKVINPEVATAWDSLSPQRQLSYMGKFKQNSMGSRIVETPETLRKFQEIKGQSIDDPVAFLERDIPAEKLPNSSLKSLINLQYSLKQQSSTDPRVGRALQILGPDMAAAGISKKNNQEGYYQFIGAMQDALEDFHNQNKKMPTAEDVKTIGARLMQEQVTEDHWYGNSKVPLYSMSVPEDDDKRIRQSPFWQQKGITVIRPDMVQRYYAAEQYNKLYGKKGE